MSDIQKEIKPATDEEVKLWREMVECEWLGAPASVMIFSLVARIDADRKRMEDQSNYIQVCKSAAGCRDGRNLLDGIEDIKEDTHALNRIRDIVNGETMDR